MKTVTEHEIESPGEAKRQAREAFNDRVDHYSLGRAYSIRISIDGPCCLPWGAKVPVGL